MSSDVEEEMFYPRPAESDIESEAAAADYINSSTKAEPYSESVKDEPSDDCECMICYELLLDPVSLHCGHTFCQLCVAKLCYNNNNGVYATLQCPVCKKPCPTVSSVNIQLRNIIESRHPQLTMQRRADMSEDDRTLVMSVLRSKQAETHHHAGQLLHNNRAQLVVSPFTIGACIVLMLLFGICVVMVTVTSVMNTADSGNFLTKSITLWGPEDVGEWVDGLGEWAHNYREIFIRQKINGPLLLLLRDQKDLHTLGIDQGFPSAGFLEAIEELRQHEYHRPRNFQEYKAAHLKRVLTLALCYKMWPRITFISTYLFNYRDVFVPTLKPHVLALMGGRVQEGEQYLESQMQPDDNSATEAGGEPVQLEEGTAAAAAVTKERTKRKQVVEGEMTIGQQLVILAAILLVPHVLVGCFAWSWTGVHPYICTAIIIHCMVSSWRELRTITMHSSTRLPETFKSALSGLIRNGCGFAATSLAMSVMCFFIPNFICEILFYFILWHTIFKLLTPNSLGALRRLATIHR